MRLSDITSLCAERRLDFGSVRDACPISNTALTNISVENVSGYVHLLICFCVDTSGSMTKALSFSRQKTKINSLSKVLKNIIIGIRTDPKMRHSVAISIVTYNPYAQIKEPFQDAVLYEVLEESCSFDEVTRRTNMTNGPIRVIQQEMTDMNQNSYALTIHLTC